MVNYIIVFFTAMVPVLELRAAIPIGIAAGIPAWLSFLIAVVGNLIPVPLIILLIRRIFEALRKTRLRSKVEWFENHAYEKGKIVHKYSLFGLFLLVAVPLPGTGAWTGALVAALLDIRMKHSILAIFAGLLAAGLIVLAVSCGISSF